MRIFFGRRQMNNTDMQVISLESEPVVAPVVQAPDACRCGEESCYGVHGLKNNTVYSEYYCNKCYYDTKRNGTTGS